MTTRYPTQHFTPDTIEGSAYAWDRLADAVIGHEGEATEQARLMEAFALLSAGDARLLATILEHVPAVNTGLLARAAQRVRSDNARNDATT